MAKMSTEDLEGKLRALRLKTSPTLDARVKEMWSRAERDAAGDKAPSPHRITRLRFKPIVAAAVVAAVCAVALTVWWLLGGGGAAPSAYAELMEALENSKAAEWVHLQGTVAGEEVEVWVSLQPLQVFTRTGQRVEANDYFANRKYVYDSTTRTVTFGYLADEPELEKAQSYYDVMLQGLQRAREAGAEVTRTREVVEGRTYSTFTVSEPKQRFIVDPQAHRIVRMEGETTRAGKFVINVDYPREGPSEILSRYELHIAASQLVESGLAALIGRDEKSGNG